MLLCIVPPCPMYIFVCIIIIFLKKKNRKNILIMNTKNILIVIDLLFLNVLFQNIHLFIIALFYITTYSIIGTYRKITDVFFCLCTYKQLRFQLNVLIKYKNNYILIYR